MDEPSPASSSGRSASRVLGVVCDLDGTLYHQRPLQAIMALHVALSLLVRPRRTLRDIRIIRHLRRAQERLRGEMTEGAAAAEAQLAWTAQATGIDLKEISSRFHFWMEEAPLRFLPFCARKGLVRLLRRWHERSVPMAVYSDYPIGGKLEALRVAPLFQAAVCSWDDDVRTFKPAARGFEVAAGRLALDPGQVVYIGDRERVDGEGARSAGMRAVIVGRRGWRDQLRALDEALDQARADGEAMRCWICGCPVRSLFRPSTMHGRADSSSVRITDSTYGQSAALHRCGHCGFVFAQPLPYPDMLSLYRGMVDPEYQATASARRTQMRRFLELAMASHPAPRTLLDVGAATGLLVLEAAAKGLQADGIEPSKWCVDVARDVNGVQIRHGTLEYCSAGLGRYDLVMLVDVLEHVVDPMSLLRRASGHLAAGGRLVVVTPDIGSGLARLMGRRWWHHRVGHIGYFSRRSIRRAFRLCGLQVVQDVPVGWRFPAGYVCQRLARYVPIPIIGTALRKLAGSRWSRRELDLSFRDSRMYIAARAGKQP